MGKQRKEIEEGASKKVARGKGKEQASKSSASRASRDKRKEPVVEQEGSDHSEREASETESDEAITRKNKGKGVATSVDKGKGKSQTPSKKKYTYAQYMERFKDISFIATRYPDPEILEAMGIAGDVESIFDNMGLKKFFAMAHDTYVDLTKEFLASLKLVGELTQQHHDDQVCIHFKIRGRSYKVNTMDLRRIYGFQKGGDDHVYMVHSEPRKVWDIIGEGPYRKGITKASHIRHPAIRYAHKALANTFLARRETGSLTWEDARYLLIGIKPSLPSFNNGDGIYSHRDRASYGWIFFNFLLDVQEWTMTTRDKTPQVSIGGILTPIFIDKGVPLTGKVEPLTRMDKYYLSRTLFLSGTLGSYYAYKFQATSQEEKKILLPRPNLTSLLFESNVAFNHGEEHWYAKDVHGDLKRIPKSKPDNEEEEIEGPSEETYTLPLPRSSSVYGSARYDFEPYDEPIRQGALKSAHEHIHLLQRFVKWQQRSMKKMGKQIKYLTGEVKQLKNKFSGAGCSNNHRDDALDPAMEQTEEDEANREAEDPMEQEEETRHSFHGVPTPIEEEQEPPRASSFEPRQRRRKRRATRSPTPPLPTSSNESYSFESDSWY